MYVPYYAHNKYRGNMHTAKSNERDGSNDRNYIGDCSEAHDEEFDHARLRRVVLDELHQVPYSTKLGYHMIVIAT